MIIFDITGKCFGFNKSSMHETCAVSVTFLFVNLVILNRKGRNSLVKSFQQLCRNGLTTEEGNALNERFDAEKVRATKEVGDEIKWLKNDFEHEQKMRFKAEDERRDAVRKYAKLKSAMDCINADRPKHKASTGKY